VCSSDLVIYTHQFHSGLQANRMKVAPYLKILAEKDGSDLYLSTGARPTAKFSGAMKALGKDAAPPGWVESLANELMSDKQKIEFKDKPEMNLALSLPDVGRFRVNIFKQRNEVAMVIRNIVTDIPNLKELGLPDVLKKVVMLKRGLVLFVGGTGSGKSTSLAALIDHRNTNSSGHIITIEDPIEFVHQHKGCIINQREVGMDTDCYEDALKNTLRQAPDVILIGEIRDRETMEHALAFAETGHLAISTLHANNANQALESDWSAINQWIEHGNTAVVFVAGLYARPEWAVPGDVFASIKKLTEDEFLLSRNKFTVEEVDDIDNSGEQDGGFELGDLQSQLDLFKPKRLKLSPAIRHPLFENIEALDAFYLPLLMQSQEIGRAHV